MFEKVNPAHPDKVADRIAGAIVDMAYALEDNPTVAVEVLIGHGHCNIVIESSVARELDIEAISEAAKRINRAPVLVDIIRVGQDTHLAKNQAGGIRCGDNGIFRGVPTTTEQKMLSELAHEIYTRYPTDGKYLTDGTRTVICQSHVSTSELTRAYPFACVNPLGAWTGGTDVDTGATNRKLGSDMGSAATGGGLHGKDLSKADVSVSIYAHLQAKRTGKPCEFACAIGDDSVGGIPFTEIVEEARAYIATRGGFERFAEWGLI